MNMILAPAPVIGGVFTNRDPNVPLTLFKISYRAAPTHLGTSDFEHVDLIPKPFALNPRVLGSALTRIVGRVRLWAGQPTGCRMVDLLGYASTCLWLRDFLLVDPSKMILHI